MGAVIEVRGVSKAFRIPTERRDTLREHVLGLSNCVTPPHAEPTGDTR